MSINHKEIGERIQRLRLDCKISQMQMADQLHISRNTVARMETEGRISSIELLTQLSDFFHVSTDYIVKGYYDTHDVAEELQAVVIQLNSIIRRL